MRVAILVAVLIAAASADIWSNCGRASDHLHIQSVTITPDPPQRGKNITITAQGTLDETLTGGNMHVNFKVQLPVIGWHTIIDKTYQTCDDANVKCPISAGTYSKTISELIPSNAPSDNYEGNAIMVDQTGQEVFCINLAFKL